jgi:hypothetical protein
VAVEEEYRILEDYGAIEPVEAHKIPRNSKVLSTNLVMVKKVNGRYDIGITARGVEQRDGEHTISRPLSSMTLRSGLC